MIGAALASGSFLLGIVIASLFWLVIISYGFYR